jgi:hypothetical protein
MILHYIEFHETLWMLTKHQQIQPQLSDLSDQIACISSAGNINTQLARTHQPTQEHYFHDEGT